MKKFIYIIISIALLTGMSACYKDKTNLDLTPNEIITIKGIEVNYNKKSMEDKLQIDPEVSSSMPDAEFDYSWDMYESSTLGTLPVRVNISKTKKLDYLVTNDAKDWTMVFTAKNRRTGYAKQFESTVSVNTKFTRGWYVLKTENGNSDLDLFETPAAITPLPAPFENVFQLVNGKKLIGSGKQLQYFNNYMSDVTGKLANTNAFFALTEDDGTVVNLNTFKEIRTWNKFFYEAPEVKKPGFVFEGGYGKYLSNDGGLHLISMFMANNGTFGGKLLGDMRNKPYHFSKYFITSIGGYPVLFDETSSSFATSTTFSAFIDWFSGADDTEMPVTDNNQRLLYMGQFTPFPVQGYAVMEDKTDPTKKTIVKVVPNGLKLGLYKQAVNAADKLANAKMHTLINNAEAMLYFVHGNDVYSRNLASGQEQLQFAAPAGETVTFIRHRYYNAGSGGALEAPYKFNYFIIGTVDGTGKYKVRMFRKQAGNLLAEPDFTMEGKGEPKDVIYISPRMTPSLDMVGGF